MLFVGTDGRIVASSGAFFCFLDLCLVCPYAAGKVELEQKLFALEALAQKMRDLFQKNIEAKGVAFFVEMRDFDAHAWAEAYMDGIGWIPVDFTPGFYYNTYALLRMAELARGIVLAFLFALEVLFAVLELFRWRFEQKIRGPMKHWKNMFMEAQR